MYKRQIHEGLRRELHEELHIPCTWDNEITYLGILNDDTNDVGTVHVGLVFQLTVPPHAEVSIKETHKMEGQWRSILQSITPDDIQRDGLNYETWSEILLDALYR